MRDDSRRRRRGCGEIVYLDAVVSDAAGDPDTILGLRAGRQAGVAGVERGRLGGALEADRIGLDAHPAQRGELLQPDAAKRIVVLVGVPGWIVHEIVGAHRPAAPS